MNQRNRLNGHGLWSARRFLALGFVCFMLIIFSVSSHAGAAKDSPQGQAALPLNRAQDEGEETHRPLDAGTAFERRMAGGQFHFYSVKLDKEQFFHAIVQQQGIDVVIEIYDPQGRRLVQVDRPSGSRGPEGISLVAGMPGVYRLKVVSLEKSAAEGSYRIKMDGLRRAVVADEHRILAEKAVSEGELLRARGTADSFKQAIEKFEQSLSLWRALGERYEEAVALYGIAWTYSSVGEYQMAVAYFDKAFPLMQESQDRYGEAVVLTGLAWGYMYLGETEQAFQNFSKAFQLHSSLESARGQAITLHGLGWAHALRGENQQALKEFSQALVLRRAAKDRRGEALTLVGMGKIHYRLGDGAKALEELNRALQLLRELGDKYAEADVLSNVGWVYVSANENNLALDFLTRALSLRRAVGDRAGEATTLYGIARAERQQRNFARARERMLEAIQLIESLRTKGANQQLRTSYFASVQEYYEFYVDLLMQMHALEPAGNYSSQALDMSERARNRNLLDLLIESNVDIRQGVDSALLEEERALQQQLNAAAERQRQLLSAKHNAKQAAAAASEVAGLTAQFQQVEARIRETSPRYAALTQPLPLSTAEIQRQVLDEETLLLEYALGEKRSFLWAVTPLEVNSYELPGRSEIEPIVRRIYDLLTERNRKIEGETGEEHRARVALADREYEKESLVLSRMLLAPVAEKLGAKRLLIVTQGALQFIPFGILPSPLAKDGNAGRRRALITEHEIVSVPSASTLAILRGELRGRKPAPKALAVFADPVFSPDDERLGARGASNRRAALRLEPASESKRAKAELYGVGEPTQQLPRLFLSRWEAGRIGSLVRAGESLQALDFRASRALATSPDMAQYRILHFATHAIIDNVHPELSGIALSQVDERGLPQAGFLRAHEIFSLRLPAELVVLSACRTGLGKSVEGEGLIGMTRGFMYAGAPRVVVSLWAVNDKATSELMVRFYRKMLGAERLPPAAALRAAQIEMSADERWQSPYFWGAFILQGEWRLNNPL